MRQDLEKENDRIKVKKKGFTIIELLVVLAVLGVFSVVAYPNISNWITDREVKKEAYEIITYLKERRNEVQTGKYGMLQVVMSNKISTYKMTNEDFFKEYKSIEAASSTYKTKKECGYKKPNSFNIDTSLNLELGSNNSDSAVNTYPSSSYSVICITKDGSIKYEKTNINTPDTKTNKNVDYFLLCSKNNSTQSSCKTDARFEHMYRITWDRFVNTKLYKYNKKKNSWMKIDG